MSPIALLAVILLGSLLTLALLGFAFASGTNADKIAGQRLEKMRERFSNSQDALAKAQMRRILALRESKLDSIVKGFIPRPAELRARLSRTGKDWTLGQYGMACGGLFLFMTVVFAFGLGMPFLLALLLGILIGLAVPHMVVGMIIGRRIKKFIELFPDAIDLLVRGLRSGLPISESLSIVGRELPDPVGVEFRTVSDKIRIGRTMEQALMDTAQRINTPEFQFFVITLAIQRETGGNLAETLGNLSDVLRKRMQMKLKIKAMSSEAKASAYIVGALPFLVFGIVSAMNPGYVAPFTEDVRLMIAGGGALVWMGIGCAIMAKMINFEI